MIFGASTNGDGQCMIFPDVCKTPAPPAPPIPIPYPNIAMLTQIDGGTASDKVKIMGKKTATKDTEITVSSGDEPGSIGGVISNKFKGPAKCKKGSSKVKVEGKEMAYHTTMWGQNGGSNANCPAGVQVAPSQQKVKVTP
jgi:hypothetical protein